MASTGNNHTYHTVIIGAGFGGLCAAYNLTQAGFDDILILEQASAIGGTWRDNTYPGAACDIPSHFYSYSFFPNPDWQRRWTGQEQILEYTNEFADKFDLRKHVKLSQTVKELRYDEGARSWKIDMENGDTVKARFVISAVGQLHVPNMPSFPGQDGFKGASFHSARWDHAVDLTGKSVGVIGAAASAVQFMPTVAAQAASVTVYQRTPNWILKKNDRDYRGFEKWLFRHLPFTQKLSRLGGFCLGEFGVFPVIKGAPIRRRLIKFMCRHHLHKAIKDQDLRAKLTPEYPVGAKRILFVDDYYETLAQDHVDLETGPVSAITNTGITSNETVRDHDVIIYATGFVTNPFLTKLTVKGQGGTLLSDHWKDGAKAYLGMMTEGFPNLFFMYGPNTNTGHSSIIYKHENTAIGITKLIKAAGDAPIEISAAASAVFDTEMQERLNKLAWAKIDNSWYKTGARIPNNWPGTAREFKKRVTNPPLEAFEIN